MNETEINITLQGNQTSERQGQGKNNSRNQKAKFRKRRLAFVLIVILLFWLYSNYTLKTTKVSISTSKVRSNVRIAVISDLHASKHGIGNWRILRRINRASPDAVMILGDMYTSGSSWDLIEIPIELTKSIVDAGYPVYYVTGEHDTNDEYKRKIAQTGAHLMDYKSEIVNINNNKFQIMGIDNVYYTDTFDLNNEFTLRADCYNILMAHIPNFEKFASFGADLTLCADTHGEMIQLPFGLGPLYSSESSTWFPKLSGGEAVYDKGMFSYNGGQMFITSGIGDAPAPIRLNNRPEVVVIDIQPE